MATRIIDESALPDLRCHNDRTAMHTSNIDAAIAQTGAETHCNGAGRCSLPRIAASRSAAVQPASSRQNAALCATLSFSQARSTTSRSADQPGCSRTTSQCAACCSMSRAALIDLPFVQMSIAQEDG